MSRTIEMKEEHDPSSYFCFQPVIIEKSNKITWEDTRCLEEKLLYNRERYDGCGGYIHHFEWYLTDNFYTYESLEKCVMRYSMWYGYWKQIMIIQNWIA